MANVMRWNLVRRLNGGSTLVGLVALCAVAGCAGGPPEDASPGSAESASTYVTPSEPYAMIDEWTTTVDGETLRVGHNKEGFVIALGHAAVTVANDGAAAFYGTKAEALRLKAKLEVFLNDPTNAAGAHARDCTSQLPGKVTQLEVHASVTILLIIVSTISDSFCFLALPSILLGTGEFTGGGCMVGAVATAATGFSLGYMLAEAVDDLNYVYRCQMALEAGR